MNQNPYSVPSETAPIPHPDAFAIADTKKRVWHFHQNGAGLSVQSAAGDVRQEFTHEDIPKRFRIFGFKTMGYTLFLKTPATVKFRLEPVVAGALRLWMGPSGNLNHVKCVLFTRLRFSIFIGGLILLMALPLGGGSDILLPTNWFGIGLGAALILLGLLMRFWPTRFLLPFDALWFLAAGGENLYQFAVHGGSPYGLIFVGLALIFSLQGIHLFFELKPGATPGAEITTEQPEHSPQ